MRLGRDFVQQLEIVRQRDLDAGRVLEQSIEVAFAAPQPVAISVERQARHQPYIRSRDWHVPQEFGFENAEFAGN